MYTYKLGYRQLAIFSADGQQNLNMLMAWIQNRFKVSWQGHLYKITPMLNGKGRIELTEIADEVLLGR